MYLIRKPIQLFVLALALLAVFGASPRANAAAMDSKAGAVTTASGRLYVRSAPSSTAPVVTSLNKGSHITLLSRSGDWWQVEYAKGQYGYCHASYITIIQGSPTQVATGSGNLNVRSGPGTSYAKTASLPKGETVILLTSSGDWSRILYHGTKTGYVSTRYLSAGGYSAVSLAVPSFKQMDSRWAYKTVGSSGKTFAQIGCATTGIAMMESYRTGTTIYPDAMAQQLRYTASGSVYWPSHFTAVTNASGYLAGIYAQLQAGKPVLAGFRTASGKQHWVVVTGFTGGSALDAASFTIHDPGSNFRTNLQQLLDLYPVFYKYFYY